MNGLGQGGPRQRAEALAALNSAFNSSSGTKTFASRPSGRGQGTQRAAAVAALSSVLTAEKKNNSPDASLVASSSPVVGSSFTGKKYSSHYRSARFHPEYTGLLSIFLLKISQLVCCFQSTPSYFFVSLYSF